METSLLYPVTNDQRTDQKLDGLWQFKFDEAGEGEKSGWETGFHDGVSMPVPALLRLRERHCFCGLMR